MGKARKHEEEEEDEDDMDTGAYEQVPMTPHYWRLFRFANIIDYVLILIGAIVAACHGAAYPLLFLFFGTLTTQFASFGELAYCKYDYYKCLPYKFDINQSNWENYVIQRKDSFTEESIMAVHYILLIGLGVFVLGTLQTFCFTLSAGRQMRKCRKKYFRAVVQQDAAFHDTTPAAELNMHLNSDIPKINSGISDKASGIIQYLSMSVCGLVVGFIYGWKLALVTICPVPAIVVSTAIFLTVTTRFSRREFSHYAKAGSIAEECIAGHKTVTAFGVEDRMMDRYSHNLVAAKKFGIKRGFITGLSSGFINLTNYSAFALSFWYGTTLVLDGEMEVGEMITTFFGVIIGAFALGEVYKNYADIGESKAAAAIVFFVLDRKLRIDVFSKRGRTPNPDNCEISFEDVDFAYPSRPYTKVLRGVTFTLAHGSKNAIVGASGCGKSTVLQLIQRCYDPEVGMVRIGGKNIKKYNLTQIRNLMAVVSQDPALFESTIAQNIRWGSRNITISELEEAAKLANCYDFIMDLPEGFETWIGEGGTLLSGGQKVRLAIARALVRDPKILILDEATASLDSQSEAIVQRALNQAMEGRTVITIAHRLSTIKEVDQIIVFDDGVVAEVGSHEDLITQNGIYANLCKVQADEMGEEPTVDDVVDISAEDKAINLLSVKSKESSLEDKEEYTLPPGSIGRLLKLNQPEWCIMIFAAMCSVIAGAAGPVNAIAFSQILTVYTTLDSDEQEFQTIMWSLMFLIIGVVSFLAVTGESSLFARSGMCLVTRLRQQVFRAIIQQDAQFFDEKEHTTPLLCSRLAEDANKVQACTGVRIGHFVKNMSAIGCALGIAFYFSWKLAFIMVASFPFISLGYLLEMSVMLGDSTLHNQQLAESARIAAETFRNIRLIQQITQEPRFYQYYRVSLRGQTVHTRLFSRSLLRGFSYGYSQCVVFFTFAAVFRLGLDLVISREITFESVFGVLIAVLFGLMALAQNCSYAPDFAEATLASRRLFVLLDSKPVIDPSGHDGTLPDHCEGSICLDSIVFRYPVRPVPPALNNVTIKVEAGQTIAIVGRSGGGKTTAMKLIERFYNPTSGFITLDGVDISTLNTTWLRQQFGFVDQHPILFDMSLEKNILLGDITRYITHEEVVKVCKSARCHDFINDFPDGYETRAGDRGHLLSSGERQRVAIARAMLRYPKILLLDEPTSSLDNENAQVVLSALETIQEGKTCIVISHTLQAVQKADLIYVLDNGEVVETGTHGELVSLGGIYQGIMNAQL